MSASLTFIDLVTLFGHVLGMSLLAVGGAMAIVPEMRRVMVGNMGLLTDEQFNASIAIAQAAPGPNVLFVAALGYQVAGLVGATMTLAAMLLPSAALAYCVARWSQARRDRLAMQVFRAGMAPVVVALVLATGWSLGTHAPDWRGFVLTCLTAALAWRTRIHVLVLVAAGGAAGALGWI